jgi:hypothetical protein
MAVRIPISIGYGDFSFRVGGDMLVYMSYGELVLRGFRWWPTVPVPVKIIDFADRWSLAKVWA